MSEAKYYGVTTNGKHLLVNTNNSQMEIYEDESGAENAAKMTNGYVIPIYIYKSPKKDI